jgi:hypothetical protein
MLAVLVNLLVPINHWLEPTLYTFHNTMGKELVVVREESRRLLRLHSKSSAKRVKDEL